MNDIFGVKWTRWLKQIQQNPKNSSKIVINEQKILASKKSETKLMRVEEVCLYACIWFLNRLCLSPWGDVTMSRCHWIAHRYGDFSAKYMSVQAKYPRSLHFRAKYGQKTWSGVNFMANWEVNGDFSVKWTRIIQISRSKLENEWPERSRWPLWTKKWTGKKIDM